MVGRRWWFWFFKSWWVGVQVSSVFVGGFFLGGAMTYDMNVGVLKNIHCFFALLQIHFPCVTSKFCTVAVCAMFDSKPSRPEKIETGTHTWVLQNRMFG